MGQRLCICLHSRRERTKTFIKSRIFRITQRSTLTTLLSVGVWSWWIVSHSCGLAGGTCGKVQMGEAPDAAMPRWFPESVAAMGERLTWLTWTDS